MKKLSKILSLMLALVMVVGAVVALPTTAKADGTSVYNEEFTTGDWENSMVVDAAKFSNLKFDGTETLVVTYVSTDTTLWGSQIQLATGYWSYVIENCANLNLASSALTTSYTITSDWAKLAEEGLFVKGYNMTVTDISVTSTSSSEEPSESESAPAGDALHTFTQGENFVINCADYLTGFTSGKDVVITATLTGNGYFNGTIGANSAGTWVSASQMEGAAAGTFEWTYEVPSADGYAELQLWWLNEGVTVTLDKLTITEKGAAESTEVESNTEGSIVDEKGDFSDMAIYMVVLMGAALVVVSAVAKKKMA